MIRILTLAVIAALTVPAFAAIPAPPLGADQTERVRCVAALAIVSSEQERGVGDWNSLPRLKSRGAHFAGVVGEILTGQAGQTRESVRDAILAEVATFQKSYKTLPTDTVIDCIALMDKLDPAPPPPGLTECAAMVSLAASDVQAREGMSDTTKLMITFATVLNSRARDQLRAQGKTEAENDVVIGLVKEQMVAAAKRKSTDVTEVGPDMAACLELAKP
jgi:hypothetical protein